MRTPSLTTLQRRKEKATAAAEARRRDLRERYPNMPAQAFSALEAGTSGKGMKALRAWINSIGDLVASIKPTQLSGD